MNDYLMLEFDVVGETETRRAKVRPGLVVSDLILEIGRKFQISDPQNYELYRLGISTPLQRGQPLIKQGVQDGARLVLSNPALQHRRPISSQHKALLQLQDNKLLIELQWQPAVIGRPDAADAIHTALLAVNLEWLPNSRRISRRHAQITEEAGLYYLEALAPNNPTFLNREKSPLEINQRRPLKHNDRIQLRNSGVILTFIMQD